MTQILEFKSATSADLAGLPVLQAMENGENKEQRGTRARPWTPCPAMSRAQLHVGSGDLSVRFDTRLSDRGRSKRLHDFTRERHRTRERVPEGWGSASKMRTLFEDAHPFRKVSILENPEDSFEDAHLFARCARKVRTFETRTVPN
jgi:hypothetical protein